LHHGVCEKTLYFFDHGTMCFERVSSLFRQSSANWKEAKRFHLHLSLLSACTATSLSLSLCVRQSADQSLSEYVCESSWTTPISLTGCTSLCVRYRACRMMSISPNACTTVVVRHERAILRVRKSQCLFSTASHVGKQQASAPLASDVFLNWGLSVDSCMYIPSYYSAQALPS
jgi:hypothetical protein